MRSPVRVGIGVLIALTGAVWTFQGLGFIKGSFMTGSATWAIIGPIVAALGIALAVAKPRRNG